jgi:hypothetical protein
MWVRKNEKIAARKSKVPGKSFRGFVCKIHIIPENKNHRKERGDVIEEYWKPGR